MTNYFDPVRPQEAETSLDPGGDELLARIRTRRAMEGREKTYGVLQGLGDSIRMDTVLGRLGTELGNPNYAYDPSYTTDKWREQFDAVTDVSPSHLDRLGEARSAAHFEDILRSVRAEQERESNLAGLGWTGVGLRVLTSMLDPAQIALGAATGGLGLAAAKAMQARRLGLITTTALAAAGGNVAAEGMLDALGRPTSTSDYLLAGSIGFAFGAAGGALARTPNETFRTQRAMRELSDLATGSQLEPSPSSGMILGTPGTRPQGSWPKGTQSWADGATPSAVPEARPVSIEAPKPREVVAQEILVNKLQGPKFEEAARASELARLAQSGVDAYQQALVVLAREGKASGSLIGRRLNIKLSEASKLVARMEAEGFVSPAAKNGSRKVLKKPEVGPELDEAYKLELRESLLTEADKRIAELSSRAADAIWTTAAAGGDAPSPQVQQLIARSAGAAGAPATTDPLSRSSSWMALRNDSVSKAAGFLRFDLAGVLGGSKNPAVRAMASLLTNDTVGRVGHAVNPFSADLDLQRTMKVYSAAYYRGKEGAFRDWAKRNGKGASDAIEFQSLTAAYVRNTDPMVDFDPAVKEFGEHVRHLHRELLADLKNPLRRQGGVAPAVPGFEDVDESDTYLWRLWEPTRVNKLIDQYGQSGLEQLIRGAIAKAQPTLRNDYLDKLARGFTKSIYRRASGIEDEYSVAFGTKNKDKLRAALTEDLGTTDEEAEAIIKEVFPRTEGSKPSNAKHRVLMDESFAMELPDRFTGQLKLVRLTDAISDDLDHLMGTYIRRTAGLTALGRQQLRNPAFGLTPDEPEFLINGLSDPAAFSRFLVIAQERGADMGLSADEIAKDADNLRFAYDRIRGIPLEAEKGGFARALRRLREFQFIRLMQNVGWSQVQEMANVMTMLGLRASISHAPALKRATRKGMELRLVDELADELEAIAGIGTDRLRGLESFRYDQGTSFWDAGGSPQGAKVDMVLDKGQRIVSDISGMSWITMMMERWTAKVIAQRFADMAGKTPSAGDVRRMAQLGLSEDMLKRVNNQVAAKASFEDGLWFNKKVKRLNLDSWDDLEARAAFENTLYRYVHKIVQQQDIGSMATWMHHPVAKTIFQFRVFALTAWTNQLQHAIHMRDSRAVAMVAASSMLGALIFALQTQVASIGRSDREEYLENRLSTESLAAAAFARTGWSSILPMMIDTGTLMAGTEPWFDFRATGQPSNIIFGNPTVSMLFEDIPNAVNAAVGPLTSSSEDYTQKGLRDISRVVPGNWIPIQVLLSTMASGLPERPLN